MKFDDAIRRESCYDMTESLGVKMCYEVFLPISNSDDHPAFPFTGPSSVEVYIKKEDTFEKYHMEATVEHVTVSFVTYTCTGFCCCLYMYV